ncbi:hypothetical protein FNW02_03835 [Komarekiella sp. 'clone 1']|uniref:Uncharacterized protein n=1 Tax=Komarekiella delphini-convector SJRDD-AB1 TaxID=2593771 RepID=A0AA40STK1_9NOST|nr:hypothetical protein [Komarekiella delphini-convector]MBD6615004.1 hypothetical protein [Komarekiella delphini-convector SJRDD-AB1]
MIVKACVGRSDRSGIKPVLLAAQILGASIKKMITDQQIDKDWIIDGDFNAELATQDFLALRSPCCPRG